MSGNANIIVVEGRLTRDPSYIKTKNGKSLCKFSIANNRYYYVNGSLQKEVYFFGWEKSRLETGTVYDFVMDSMVGLEKNG